MSAIRLPRILAAETKYEFLKVARMPAYAVPTLVFPVMFYVIFGLSFGPQRAAGPTTIAAYLIATMGAFGVIGASLFGLGVSVAGERGQGWLTVKRASPMPMSTYFGAKVLMAMIFSTTIVAMLFTLGASFGHVRLGGSEWLALAGALVFGAAPFCAFGLAIGYMAGPNSAPAVVNLVYLPMAFASGLWMPLEILPKFIQQAAPFLPAYHLAQLALGTVGAGRGTISNHVLALLAFTALFLAVAGFAFRRDEGKTYG